MTPFSRRLDLEEQLALERALEDAFAPARGRSARISAARVRARVAWEREEPSARAWRRVSFVGRLSEASLALGLTAVLFAGSLGGLREEVSLPVDAEDTSVAGRVSAALDDRRFIRWLRIGRSAPLADDIDPTVGPARAADADVDAAPRERGGVRLTP